MTKITSLNLQLSKGDLIDLNRCRMFLGAIVLSDIATADGKGISPEALEGKKMTDREAMGEYPFQPQLDKRQIQL